MYIAAHRCTRVNTVAKSCLGNLSNYSPSVELQYLVKLPTFFDYDLATNIGGIVTDPQAVTISQPDKGQERKSGSANGKTYEDVGLADGTARESFARLMAAAQFKSDLYPCTADRTDEWRQLRETTLTAVIQGLEGTLKVDMKKVQDETRRLKNEKKARSDVELLKEEGWVYT